MKNIRWPVVALATLLIGAVVSLAVTASTLEAPAWWQAILSGVAILASICVWRIDRGNDRRERAERMLREKELEQAEGRSATIQILDDVLILDAWVRQLLRLGIGPDESVTVGTQAVRVVRTAPPLEDVRAATSNLHRMGPGSIHLQRSIFRYRQLVKLLEEAHDPDAAIQSTVGLTPQSFQEALQMIATDLDSYIAAVFTTMWGEDASAYARARAERQAQGVARVADAQTGGGQT